MHLPWLSLVLTAAAASAPSLQSPIDLPRFLPVQPNQANVSLSFGAAPGVVVFDTTTVRTFWTSGAMTLNDHAFAMVQFHHHAPSEHKIGGRSFPFELHFVHVDDGGANAVLAILFDVGDEPSPFLDQLLRPLHPLGQCSLPLHAPGDTFTIPHLDATLLQFDQSNLYRYTGSLTTAPFTEGVEWAVLDSVATISPAQLAAFRAVVYPDNARPTQPRHGRDITLVGARCYTMAWA
ncbi:Aste57867_994 [Aphanomyces stellatus]|uniref:Carbonic anhydrase n=1 Tax=Aphanomyces stellatus TaxID=120398 RepID=A0A485K4A9_9STRA|nr:hypothetical protein As57867_000993 [Aphanomyces stellatus]VFT78216.1 Aste57867_994 [Aphanomyces stellatus]